MRSKFKDGKDATLRAKADGEIGMVC